MKTDQIKRSIYYYEWLTYSNSNELNEIKRDKSSEKIIKFLRNTFEKQKKADSYKDFIVKTSQGEEFIIVDAVEESSIRFRIVLCRENALPYIEKDGKLEGLGNYIDADQNIAEVTHCVFFVKYGILGAEYNNNGARATSVTEYMIKQTNSDVMSTCRAKLNYDVYSKLIQDESFSLFDFAVATNSEAYNNVLSKKSIFRVIQSTVPDSDTMEVVLKRRKTKKNKNTGFQLPITFDEIKDLLTNYREDIQKLNVSQSGIGNAVDLLTDKFVGKIILAKTSDRMIDSEEMYASIVAYFGSNVEKYCNAMKEESLCKIHLQL